MKVLWRRIIILCCIASLLIATPGIDAFANELQRIESVEQITESDDATFEGNVIGGDGAEFVEQEFANLSIGEVVEYQETPSKADGIDDDDDDDDDDVDELTTGGNGGTEYGKDIADTEIVLNETQYVYDGEEKKPMVTVKYLGGILQEDTDYSVTYVNNINAGTAKVAIKGIGEFVGEKEETFLINRAPQSVWAEPYSDEIGVNTEIGIRKKGTGFVSYSSSDESVATVNYWDGYISGHKEGTATITVIYDGYPNYLPASTSFVINVRNVYKVASGSCGDEAVWNYYNDGTVRVTGQGAMKAVRQFSGHYNWEYYYEDRTRFKKVSTVIVEDGITAIDEYAFAKSKNMVHGYMSDSPETVILADTVKTIGEYTFYNCENLKTIEIGSGLTNVGEGAFGYCEKLEQITLPDSVKSIGTRAFYSCNNLKSIELGADFSQLGNYALSYCPSLEQIKVAVNNSSFKTVDGILYDKNMTTLYKLPSNAGIKDYVISEGITTIYADAVGDVATLQTVTLPRSLKQIMVDAFDGCTGLSDVFYEGSKYEWEKVDIGSNNSPLKDAKIHFASDEGVDISECSAKLVQTTYTYNGKKKKPAVEVCYDGIVLENGVDYTVSYSDNTDAGTAKAIVKGKGNNTGKQVLTFTIRKAEAKLVFQEGSISKKVTDKAFTNSLTKTTDGTITFQSGNERVAKVDRQSGSVTVQGAGWTRIIATAEEGKNYRTVTASYTLTVTDGSASVTGYPALNYTYEITPILSPFAYMVYVKTDNPDVSGIRFVDKSVSIGDGDYAASYIPCKCLFADVKYENPDTFRINGGYIFIYDSWSSLPDGGTLTLQVIKHGQEDKAFAYYGSYSIGSRYTGETMYQDTDITVSCPKVQGMMDYIMENYIDTSEDLFTNLDTLNWILETSMAVYPKAVLYNDRSNRNRPYPFYAASGWQDYPLEQHCDVYDRYKPGILLSKCYPFVLDSLSFPSAMRSVAERLQPDCQITSGNMHWQIIVAYDGVKKRYGGAGIGSTNGIYLEDIDKCFTFDGSDGDLAAGTTLEEMRDRLIRLGNKGDETAAAIGEKLNGKEFRNAIGKGSWIRVGYNGAMAYVIPDSWGSTDFLSNVWVDGRYVNNNEIWEKGTKFSEHPNSDIVIPDMSYTNDRSEECKGTVIYRYIKTSDSWSAESYYFTGSTSGKTAPKEFYLTREQVEAMMPDCNTDTIPHKGLIYDGTVEPGTPFENVLVTGIKMGQKQAVVEKDTEIQLKASVVPSDAFCQDIEWSSSDETIATITSWSGVVTGVAPGTATITATTIDGRKSATCTVTVVDQHSPVAVPAVPATCTETGLTEGSKCSVCGKVLKKQKTVPAKGHNWGEWITVKEPTETSKGQKKRICKSDSTHVETEAIPELERVDIGRATLMLSATSYTYSGKAKKPKVTVKDGDTVLALDKDYTISYENNKNAGTATVKVMGIGKYQGENSAKFSIKKAASKLLFANESISKISLDEAFTNDLTKTTDGAVSFTSSDEKVATVDGGSGLVSIMGSGTVTITANATEGNNYKAGKASYVIKVTPVGIEKASVAGVSLSYGYSGKAYTPAITVTVNGVMLAKDADYTVNYENNKNPGTAKITITGKGKYTGTRLKTFEIVDCVSSIVSGKTYQLIPKNNSKTAVCSYSGKMVNNTKVYITDRSSSEAMKFKAVKNTDGTWKFINAKCELALAVQQNSSEVGKGTVLYDQTTKKAQNWKLSKKSDNSFAIMNAVTGYSIAMSDASAVKGTTLSMAETTSSGLQRFYIAETTAVSTPFDGTYGVKAAKDKKFALNIASSSKSDGANVNLYSYSNVNAKKFKIMYSGGGYYRLVNVNSGLVLTVNGNAKTDGANIVQSSWSAAEGQRWKIVKQSDGTVTLTNALGTVLHLSGNKTSNGTNVIAKKAASTKAQRWYLQ